MWLRFLLLILFLIPLSSSEVHATTHILQIDVVVYDAVISSSSAVQGASVTIEIQNSPVNNTWSSPLTGKTDVSGTVIFNILVNSTLVLLLNYTAIKEGWQTVISQTPIDPSSRNPFVYVTMYPDSPHYILDPLDAFFIITVIAILGGFSIIVYHRYKDRKTKKLLRKKNSNGNTRK